MPNKLIPPYLNRAHAIDVSSLWTGLHPTMHRPDEPVPYTEPCSMAIDPADPDTLHLITQSGDTSNYHRIKGRSMGRDYAFIKTIAYAVENGLDNVVVSTNDPDDIVNKLKGMGLVVSYKPVGGGYTFTM